MDAVVRQMRDALIDNDLKLLAAVNARITLAKRLDTYTRQHDLEALEQVPDDWMHRYIRLANRGPLSEDGLRELYGHLLELTRREIGRGDPS